MQKKLPYERVLVTSLTLDPRNARKHDKKNLKAIKDSLFKFGQQRTIVVTKDNVVIAGNGTVAAAKELGWETIDITRSQLTGENAIAYGLVDNRASDLAEWDDDNLKGLLSDLSDSGWDIEGLGWDKTDIEILNNDDFIVDDKEDNEKNQKYVVTIDFKDAVEMEEMFIELRDRGLKVKCL